MHTYPKTLGHKAQLDPSCGGWRPQVFIRSKRMQNTDAASRLAGRHCKFAQDAVHGWQVIGLDFPALPRAVELREELMKILGTPASNLRENHVNQKTSTV